jgi:hypothetical protein
MLTQFHPRNHFRIRNPFILASLALLLGTGGAHAAFSPDKGFGVGFILGAPTGISGSLPVGDANAFNALLGYDVTQDANLYLHGDYVWHRHDVFPPVDKGAFSLFYGPGVAATISRDPVLGVRAVVGVDYRLPDAPIRVLFEIAPGISILPRTEILGSGGLGLRYYF